MNRSLQANTPKKNGDVNGHLKQSRSKQFQGKMVNFTEVLIQTNDSDVPFIAIYKPYIKKQQRRVQCATIIERNLKKFELFRLHFAFNKMNHLKTQEKRLSHNVHMLEQLFTKIQNKRTSHAFLQLAASKMKKKNVNSAAKILAYFQTKTRNNNIKYCMNRLKINNYQAIISTLANENQLSHQLKQARDQLFKLKLGLFDQQFIEKSKLFVKFTDHNTFIDNIREMNYSSMIKGETARFELQRSKATPKKKDTFDNQLVASVLGNAIRAYEANIAEHIRYEEELKQQLESYTNIQGISELNEVIRQKDATLSDMESFVAEITRMDNQMKRFAGDKMNSQKILALIAQQEKKLEVRSKKSDGMITKLYNSRVFLDTVIAAAFKRSIQDKEAINKLLDQLNQMSHQEQHLRTYLKKIKDNHSIKTMTETLLSFYEEINQLSRNLQAEVASNQKLAKEMEKLLAQSKQNKATIKQITKEIQQLKRIDQIQESNINSLLQFITTNQLKIEQNHEIDLLIKVQINERFQAIFKAISSLLNHIYILQNQKQGYIRQIEELQKKNSHLNETKRDEVPSSPKIQGISDISLAERFMTPLKEMLETRQEDKQLKQHILTFEQKIEELIKQNLILQQKLFSMQTNEKVLSEMSFRITQLKTQNDNLKRNNQNYNEILMKYEQSKQQIAHLTEQNLKIGFLSNKITEYEFRLRELSILNAELAQKITSLKESNSQFSSIASSNLQLSEKINEIYNKSTTKIITQGSEQQLMKQTQLMQEILTLKIQLENTAIKHIQEVNSLRNEINSYQTIISKIQVDIAHRENEIIQRQNIIQSLNAKFSQIREVNIELRQKVEQYEKVITIETIKKSKDDEQQLNRLRQDCQHMFEELQITIDNLRGKDNHIHSLELTLGSQEDVIASLKRENERLMMNIQELIEKNEQAEHLISRQKTQITQIKGQFHELQLQFHQHQISQTQVSHSSQVYQRQIQQKQMIINNLLEQIKALSASHTAQLNQLKQQFTSKERVYEQRLSDKDLRISKLQFQLNEKINTVLSLQQLISLYASSSESAIRHQAEHFAYPYSRDKEIVFLRGQIKSLEQFLNDMANQYQELEKKYQQERERTNRAYLNVSPVVSTEKLDFKTTVFSSEHNKQARYAEEVSERFNHSFLSNISMTFTESDITKQLNRLMASNESLANSVDYLREENKELFLKIKSISSIQMVIELVFNILLMISRFKPESSEGAKIWNDLCHLRTVYSGETLFINLEEYCREFIHATD